MSVDLDRGARGFLQKQENQRFLPDLRSSAAPFRQRCHPDRYEERSQSLAALLLLNFIALLSH